MLIRKQILVLSLVIFSLLVFGCGGGGGGGGSTPTPPTDWNTKADMTTARIGLTSSVVNGKIYAIGGWDIRGTFSTVEEYDPATDTWTTKTSMPTARAYLTSSAVNGKIYAIGGWHGISSTVEEYTP